MQQEREAKDEAKYLKKADTARQRWENANNKGTSPYLQRKRVGVHGIRFTEKLNEEGKKETLLLIPMRDEEGVIHAIEEIYPTKRVLVKGGKPRDKNFTNTYKGLFHIIGNAVDGNLIRIGEGYATCASCFKSTGYTVPHVVAFTAGQLKTVTPTIRRLFPNSHIQITADNDVKENQINTGIEEAKKAASLIENCSVVYPTLRTGEKCDFNDLMIEEGEEEVKAQLEGFKKKAAIR